MSPFISKKLCRISVQKLILTSQFVSSKKENNHRSSLLSKTKLLILKVDGTFSHLSIDGS